MRGENNSDWSNTNGVRLLSRDSLPSPGSGCLAMQGSELYREVLYELQNENDDDTAENGIDNDGDSSLSSDREDDVRDNSVSDGPSHLYRRTSKTRRHSVDVDDLSPLVQKPQDRYKRRENVRLSLNGSGDAAQPLINYPVRSILRQLGPGAEDDSLKARNRFRVTFKDSSDDIPSPRGRRASIAEANPYYREQARVATNSVAGRSGPDREDCARVSDAAPSAGERRGRRHSLPHLTAPGSKDIVNGEAEQQEDCGIDFPRLSLQDTLVDDTNNDDDDDNGVICEVVHSFTPRPRPRRCSYAGISGFESKYKDDATTSEGQHNQTAHTSGGSLTPRPASKTQAVKKISPSSNGIVKVTKKNATVKTGAKKDTSKVGQRKDTPNSRRHSVV